MPWLARRKILKVTKSIFTQKLSVYYDQRGYLQTLPQFIIARGHNIFKVTETLFLVIDASFENVDV